jgi:hypothetical protein
MTKPPLTLRLPDPAQDKDRMAGNSYLIFFERKIWSLDGKLLIQHVFQATPSDGTARAHRLEEVRHVPIESDSGEVRTPDFSVHSLRSEIRRF